MNGGHACVGQRRALPALAWPIALGLPALAVFAAALPDIAAPRFIVLLLLAPLLEEAVFRAGLHEWLMQRWPRHLAVANVATAAAFALAHVALRGDALAWLVAMPALLIGLLYQHRRRLRDCVALHAAMNAAWVLWTHWTTLSGTLLPGATTS